MFIQNVELCSQVDQITDFFYIPRRDSIGQRSGLWLKNRGFDDFQLKMTRRKYAVHLRNRYKMEILGEPAAHFSSSGGLNYFVNFLLVIRFAIEPYICGAARRHVLGTRIRKKIITLPSEYQPSVNGHQTTVIFLGMKS